MDRLEIRQKIVSLIDELDGTGNEGVVGILHLLVAAVLIGPRAVHMMVLWMTPFAAKLRQEMVELEKFDSERK